MSTLQDFDFEKCVEIFERREPSLLKETFGGLTGICKALDVNLETGIKASSRQERIDKYGKNEPLSSMHGPDSVCCVLREGEATEIPVSELLVGDVLRLTPNLVVPCDAVFFGALNNTTMLLYEGDITGEPDEVEKDLDKDPFILSGSRVNDRSLGYCLVVATGKNCMLGKTVPAQEEETEEQDQVAK